MDAKEFHRLSAQALERIDEVLGDLDDDRLDVDLAGDVLTLAFEGGDRFVINAHSAAGQIWMAAGTTAWHFDYDPPTQRWIARRTDDELMTTLARVVGDKLGRSVAL
ncbi:MAG: iron donor protein CyaY [Myxococcales bacterium]|nr:iron donor protein CyaY [Myxococcales bacterium]MCB9566716.1 iron donor protein CyaY [Myxococcales bacterium]MCB9704451.1 iron donor protein CyaY [Myxococcales bacterium]